MGMSISASENVKDARPNKGRVLFICYLFPPVGGAGVQRPVKFIKYLRNLGWEITVLTVSNPSVPLFDESLLADIPSDTVIHKAATLEPDYRYKARIAPKQGVAGSAASRKWGSSVGRVVKGVIRGFGGMLLQPDPQVLWLPGASREALRLLQEKPHDIIFATAPPYSSFLLGSWLKRKSGVPLVLDFRDEWDLSNAYRENSRRDQISLLVQRRMKRNILRSADGIVATTKASTRRILERSRELGITNLPGICIYNGFDDSDFPSVKQQRGGAEENGRFRIVYTGTLWNLTSVEPLVRALEQLFLIRPGLVKELELVFVGRKMSHQLKFLERLERLDCRLEMRDYCDHSEAISLMASADALCLLLSDVEGAGRVVPAKLFEYLAMGREILAIAPEGEAAEIVTCYFPDNHFTADNVPGITAWLEKRIVARDKGRRTKRMDISKFSREYQAGQLSDYFLRFMRRSAGNGREKGEQKMDDNRRSEVNGRRSLP